MRLQTITLKRIESKNEHPVARYTTITKRCTLVQPRPIAGECRLCSALVHHKPTTEHRGKPCVPSRGRNAGTVQQLQSSRLAPNHHGAQTQQLTRIISHKAQRAQRYKVPYRVSHVVPWWFGAGFLSLRRLSALANKHRPSWNTRTAEQFWFCPSACRRRRHRLDVGFAADAAGQGLGGEQGRGLDFVVAGQGVDAHQVAD